MRVGIITDSTCDLSKEYLDKHNVSILPISILYGKETFVDVRDSKDSQTFNDKMIKQSLEYESLAFSKEEIVNLFLKKIILDYDYIICITGSASKSLIYENVKSAISVILAKYKSIRQAAGITGPFQVRLLDSQQLFTGLSAVVAQAVYMLSKGYSPLKVLESVSNAAHYTQAYLIPSHLQKLKFQNGKKVNTGLMGNMLDIRQIIKSSRGQTHAVAKVRKFEAGAEKIFDLTRAHINRGLICPNVCISLGGDPSKLNEMPGFASLSDLALIKGINLLVSEMSASAIMSIGANSISVSFVSSHENIAI